MLKSPFISRSGLIENLRNHLLSGRSAAMVGGPMIGKSTLARNLAGQIKEKGAAPILIGLKELSSPAGFWALLMEAILHQGIGPGQKNPYRKNPGDLPELMKQLHHIYEKVSPEVAARPLILLLDDADALLSLPEPLVPQIVNLALESVAPSIHSICWIGGAAWEESVRKHPDAFKPPLRLYPLSVVPIREARGIIQAWLGDAGSDDAVRRIWNETGGHPVLMEKLFEGEGEGAVVLLSERLAQEIGPGEEAILSQLDPGGGWMELQMLKGEGDQRPPKELLDRLCMLGLTIRTLTDGTAAIRWVSPLLERERK
jgi:hypothetical protein